MVPSISVALATYNGERYIVEQLRSILAQTTRPSEIVVADDGSSDRTVELVRETFDFMAPAGMELRILESDGERGVTRNFERALRAARGDLIALSDQDDVWHLDRLSKAVESFERDPGLLLQHADARLVDGSGADLGSTLLEALYVNGEERTHIARGKAFESYIRRNIVTGATVVLRRRLLDFAAPFPAEWVHDEWLAIIAAAVGKVELLNDSVIDYRQHGANVIGVTAPTLGYRLGRMLQPRGDRYRQLARRAASLVARLEEVDAPEQITAIAREKARFEAVRARLPSRRLARIVTVLAERRRGSYRALSSQGDLDVLRDILQPR